MAKIKVLVAEDIKGVQDRIKDILKPHEIEVYIASDAEETRQKAERHWEELDVIILDVRLDDPKEPKTTGPEIVIKIREKKKNSFPPEFIVYTDFHDNDYYRLALDLGAAAYLIKLKDDPLVHVIKVLALRRALNGKNPTVASEVERIAARSRNISEAMLTFSHRVLKPAFDFYIRRPFIILFTEGNMTQNCADNVGLPVGSSAFYHTLQALAHAKGNPTEPFVLNTSKLTPPPNPQTAPLYKKLDGAAFLPFSLSNDMKLSIGILRAEKTAEESAADDPEVLATVLAQHLRPTVLENVINIWSQWTELRATRTNTAKLCLSVGQEINDGVETKDLAQLEDLANDLNDTGQYLAQLENRNWQNESDGISINDLVTETWKYISPAKETSKITIDLQGDCPMRAHRSDLEIVFSKLLQWFVYRSRAMPLDVETVIKIKCEETDSGATVMFEDNSHRLPKKLREDLFAPFTQAISTPFAEIDGVKSGQRREGAQGTTKSHFNTGRYLPLYLAKMLVEGRYHGLLRDHSDEITKHPYGHRILMQLPAANKIG
jgi:DNA-binding NarL/FixJ family response regulator